LIKSLSEKIDKFGSVLVVDVAQLDVATMLHYWAKFSNVLVN